ncbi:hypothetical protein H0H87_004905 [Tephrocybe sp. NHM501043]|nr:hypothetical protein H0H87_004905 [Tephrocybe sp. NHM501043]
MTYLDGKAWKFYSRDVAKNPEVWTLNMFFTKLFNEVFPVNFREKQRQRLRDFGQGKQLVKDYVANLEELFAIVGMKDERERIIKLFGGFRSSIRSELYCAKLTPEQAKWKRVVKMAMFIERAEAIGAEEQKIEGEIKKNGSGGSSGLNGGKPPLKSYKDRNAGNNNKNQHASNSSGKHTNHTPGFSSMKYKAKTNAYKPQNQLVSRNKVTSQKRPLTEEEKVDYMSAGRCFNCGATGHLSRNCPSRSNTRSGSSGKPPGIQSNSIRVNLRETERLREQALGNTTQELKIGMMTYDVDSDPEWTGEESSGILNLLTEEFGSSGASSGNEESVTEAQPTELSELTSGPPDLQTVSNSSVSESFNSEEDEGVHGPSDVGPSLEFNSITDNRYNDLHEEFIFSEPMNFGQQSYLIDLENAEEKLVMLWEEEVRRGRPQMLGNPYVRKIEYLLESMQPYPGDPYNVFQFNGHRFRATEIDDDNICICDLVRNAESVLPKSILGRRYLLLEAGMHMSVVLMQEYL